MVADAALHVVRMVGEGADIATKEWSYAVGHGPDR